MVTDSLAPKIKKNEIVFYQPELYKLNINDMVLYRLKNNRKTYVGEIKTINNQNVKLFRIGTKETVKVTKKNICGKIIRFGNINSQ